MDTRERSETQLQSLSVYETAKVLGFTGYLFDLSYVEQVWFFGYFSGFWWHPFNPTYDVAV